MGKIIRLTESELVGLVKRVIKEQSNSGGNPLINSGYKKVLDVNLPDGTYIGNVDGYEEQAEKDGLSAIPYLWIFDKNKKFTGYLGKMNMYSRGGTKNEYLSIENKKIDDNNIYEYYFKSS